MTKSPKSAAGKMLQSTRSAAKSLSLEEVVRETAEKLAHITSKLEKLDKMEQTMEEIKAENRLRAALLPRRKRSRASTIASTSWSSTRMEAASACLTCH